MIGLLTLLLLTSPYYDPCKGMETLQWRLCQPRVVNLGKWDPRPEPAAWTYMAYPDPKDWGEYPTEKRTCAEP